LSGGGGYTDTRGGCQGVPVMRLRSFPLFSPEPQPGTGNPPPDGTPPPAAAVVAKGELGEGDAAELLRLKAERDELARKVKDRECRVSELEDEAHRLRSIHRQPEPKSTRGGGWTFFHGASNED